MRKLLGQFSVGFVLAGLLDCCHSSLAEAQLSGSGGSLGGYGASMGSAGSGMGGGSMIIPYGGRTEGFMPGRMGGGSSLSFQTRPSAAMSPARGSFGLAPTAGAMSGTGGGSRSGLGGMGRGLGSRSAMSGLSSPRTSLGPGRGSFQLGSGGGTGVMPSRIGYPFRQPPSVLPSAGGIGSSM